MRAGASGLSTRSRGVQTSRSCWLALHLDETLGRLHRAGLAKEFDLTGQTELWWESMVTEAEIHDTAVHRAASPLAVVDEEGA